MQKKYDTIENILFNCRKSLPRLKKRQVEHVEKNSFSVPELAHIDMDESPQFNVDEVNHEVHEPFQTE